jgi:heme oxygenase
VANHPFALQLLRGTLPLAGYVALVSEHVRTYEVLERGADGLADDPLVRPFLVAGLRRLPALEADMVVLLGPQWRRVHPTATPALERYLDRLRIACRRGGAHFLAHHYARYLGDVIGGRHIARAVRASFDLPHPQGSQSYDIAIDGVADVRSWYRDRLDEAPLTAADRAVMCDEAVLAIELHRAMFDALPRRGASARLD